jgi:hypothetical protein
MSSKMLGPEQNKHWVCCIFFILVSKEDVYTYSFRFLKKTLMLPYDVAYKAGFFLQILFLRKEKSPYFRGP